MFSICYSNMTDIVSEYMDEWKRMVIKAVCYNISLKFKIAGPYTGMVQVGSAEPPCAIYHIT